jgi:hypothetical protein
VWIEELREAETEKKENRKKDRKRSPPSNKIAHVRSRDIPGSKKTRSREAERKEREARSRGQNEAAKEQPKSTPHFIISPTRAPNRRASPTPQRAAAHQHPYRNAVGGGFLV